MGKTNRHPVAMSMQERYGEVPSSNKKKRDPKGGSRNSLREYLEEREEDREIQREVNARISYRELT